MVRHIDAIFSQGAFRLLEPLVLPEGARVHLSVEEDRSAATNSPAIPPTARIHTPRLAHAEDAADFAMEVRETPDAAL